MNIFEQRLNRVLRIAESVTTDSAILSQLNAICHQLDIPITVIGGMAVAAHGYPRFTADIDILIKQTDATRLAQSLMLAGWMNIGSNKLQNNRTGLVLNICAEGVRAGRSIFPPPDHSDPGVKVAELPLLLILKIRANRHKDRSDVVELIKANQLSKEYLTANVLPSLQIMDQKLVLALWQTAIDEQHLNLLPNTTL